MNKSFLIVFIVQNLSCAFYLQIEMESSLELLVAERDEVGQCSHDADGDDDGRDVHVRDLLSQFYRSHAAVFVFAHVGQGNRYRADFYVILFKKLT